MACAWCLRVGASWSWTLLWLWKTRAGLKISEVFLFAPYHILGLLQSGVVSIPGNDRQPDILGELQEILTGDCLSKQRDNYWVSRSLYILVTMCYWYHQCNRNSHFVVVIILFLPPVLLAVGDVDNAGDTLAEELVTDLAQHLANAHF